MSDPHLPQRRTWLKKFAAAFRGIRLGIHGQSSFAVHAAFSVAVIGLAAALRVSLAEWCLLILCIGIVWTAEIFNSALETLAKAIGREYNSHLADGLDIASGAVLMAAISAALVGLIIFIYRIGALLNYF